MDRARIVAFALLAYIVVVGIGIEAINSAWGNVLPEWHQYAWGDGSGYGKMRGHQGEFQTILLLFGTWVYPFSVVASYLFIRQALAAQQRLNRFLLLVGAVVCLAVLGRFCYLGVFSAGVGQAW